MAEALFTVDKINAVTADLGKTSTKIFRVHAGISCDVLRRSRTLTIITDMIIDAVRRMVVVIRYRANIGSTNEVGGIISTSTSKLSFFSFKAFKWPSNFCLSWLGKSGIAIYNESKFVTACW